MTGVKTIREKFRSIIRVRRAGDKTKAAVSEVAEEIMEVEKLLDDFICENDDDFEERKKKKEESTTRENILVECGQKLRNDAVPCTMKEAPEETK